MNAEMIHLNTRRMQKW